VRLNVTEPRNQSEDGESAGCSWVNLGCDRAAAKRYQQRFVTISRPVNKDNSYDAQSIGPIHCCENT
jgi:hypothetical protein